MVSFKFNLKNLISYAYHTLSPCPQHQVCMPSVTIRIEQSALSVCMMRSGSDAFRLSIQPGPGRNFLLLLLLMPGACAVAEPALTDKDSQRTSLIQLTGRRNSAGAPSLQRANERRRGRRNAERATQRGRQRSGHGRFLRLTADAPAPTGRSRGGRGSAYFPNLPARPPRRVRAGPGG